MHVFQYADGVWSQLGNSIDGGAGDKFRYENALSSDGTILAVGAPEVDSVTLQYVSVFKFDGISYWGQMGQIFTGEPSCYCAPLRFRIGGGGSVDLSSDGNVVVFGEPRYSGKDHVYIYQFNGENNLFQRGDFICGESPPSPWDSSKHSPFTHYSEQFGVSFSRWFHRGHWGNCQSRQW